MLRHQLWITSLVVLSEAALSITCLAQALPDYRAGSLVKQEPQPIYAADPHDSWNRIFCLLFTRTVKLRLGDNFKEGGPFIPDQSMAGRLLSMQVSVGTFERVESGDRAIDPLYPSFFSFNGVETLLSDPQYAEFKQALSDAIAEQTVRLPLHRALMQADAWAAYDRLSPYWGVDGKRSGRAQELAAMLAQFIRKLALTPQEIAALPRNYAAAERSLGLPPVLDERSGWMEVEWFPHRTHDFSADFRRAARVFLKPKTKPQQFVSDLNDRLRRGPNGSSDLTGALDGVALVTESLLIDSRGQVEPSPLTFEVQTRMFVRDPQGKFKETAFEQYELSRKSLLAGDSSGGLVRFGADQPAYVPTAGNDYTFASPILEFEKPRPPILATLRRRCQTCHGVQADEIFTFAIALPPHGLRPQVRQLKSADDPHAAFVAKQKMKQADFKSLSQALY